MGVQDYTIHSILRRNAKVHGRREGWVCGDTRLTHAEFLAQSERLAKGLMELGLEKGDRIAVLAQNNMEYALLHGAAAASGAIMLPLNWRLQPEELEYCLGDGSPKFLFADQDNLALAASLLPKAASVQKAFICGPAQDGFAAFDELLDNDGQADWPEVASADPYVIFYTAAVGGRPRGAVVTHMGIWAGDLQAIAIWGLGPDSCHLLVVPISHVAGLSLCMNFTHAGGKNILQGKFDPGLVLRTIEEEKVTLLVSFSPMLETLLDLNQQQGRDISSLKVVAGQDTPNNMERLEATTGAQYWIGFGQSETACMTTFAAYSDKPGTLGPPLHASEVEVMDEAGNLLPVGQAGEIVVRGPLVFAGYWNLPEDTAHTFRYGWHHTGDKGRFDEDGHLWYLGRMPDKELIKPGGENVYPAEVEAAIREHPAVAEVAVIGVPDQQWREAIKAICVLHQDQHLPAQELIDFVASRIARFKKPKHVVYVSALPKDGDGAIDREKVKAEHGQA